MGPLILVVSHGDGICRDKVGFQPTTSSTGVCSTQVRKPAVGLVVCARFPTCILLCDFVEAGGEVAIRGIVS